MKIIPIIHLGLGNVGKEVFRLVQLQRVKINKLYGVDLRYVACFTSKGGCFQKNGITNKNNKVNLSVNVLDTLKKVTSPYILIDTTASDKTVPALNYALKHGSYVVLSNKKPLSSSQNLFDSLQNLGKQRLLYETTVGAGLPVMQTLKTFLETGDTIYSIEGCFSGTLGFICSSMERGVTYSNAVRQAQEKGFTEPDPRDDLSGLDVARKALILSRMIGLKAELKDIKRDLFFPKEISNFSVQDFMQLIQKYNGVYAQQFKKAAQNNKTLRYIATVLPSRITVGLKEVQRESSIGSLHGPDNIVVFKTKRYSVNPLVIKGPGAGVEVTAAGVFADICETIRRIV